jgi:cytidylate kinase
MIIAIDGPAASGKSTLARLIAAHYGFPHLDTGSLYRAVARDVLANGGALHDPMAGLQAAHRLDPNTLSDPALRVKGYGEAASVVAALPEVRQALLQFQRHFASQKPGTVIEGRDIGTVVCPDAPAKIYVMASLESRARRRYLELQNYGVEISEDAVKAEIALRDERDISRSVSPLRKAADALLLDTTELDIDKAFKAALDMIDAKAARR